MDLRINWDGGPVAPEYCVQLITDRGWAIVAMVRTPLGSWEARARRFDEFAHGLATTQAQALQALAMEVCAG